MKSTSRPASRFRKARAGSNRAIYCPDARQITTRLPPLDMSGGRRTGGSPFVAFGVGALAFLSVAAAIVRAAVH